jgi:hypothetical protein
LHCSESTIGVPSEKELIFLGSWLFSFHISKHRAFSTDPILILPVFERASERDSETKKAANVPSSRGMSFENEAEGSEAKTPRHVYVARACACAPHCHTRGISELVHYAHLLDQCASLLSLRKNSCGCVTILTRILFRKRVKHWFGMSPSKLKMQKYRTRNLRNVG